MLGFACAVRPETGRTDRGHGYSQCRGRYRGRERVRHYDGELLDRRWFDDELLGDRRDLIGRSLDARLSVPNPKRFRPVVEVDAVMDDDLSPAAVHGFAVLCLMLDAEHFSRVADDAGKVALAGAAYLLTGHSRLQMRTSTRGSSWIIA